MLKYIFLGVIQGMTEFLPVSSSGHLVIAQKLLGISRGQVELEIILHLGTLLAVLIFFFKDILKACRNIKLLLWIALVTLITGIIGVSAKDFFESLFSAPQAVCAAWIFTGLVLLATRNFTTGKREDLNLKDALFLALAQSLAIVPGVSRSGMTISMLLWRKVEKTAAFSFSFLVSIPVIFGAAVLKAKDIGFVFQADTSNLLFGFIFSCLSGIIALGLLKKVLAKAKFYYFGYYCIVVAIVSLLLVK